MANQFKTSEKGVSLWPIEADQAGQRIDNFLIKHLKGMPKSHLYRLLRKGEVRVNKKRIKPDYRLQEGDVLRVAPMRLSTPSEVAANPPKRLSDALLETILYEDDQMLIINKPAGTAVHGGSGVSWGVIELLRHSRRENKFFELVHRLDRDTSGCLLIAKKPAVLKELHALIRSGAIDKHYWLLTKGYWPKHIHFVDAPLKKYVLQSGERKVSVDKEGKSSYTEFKILKRFKEATLLEAKLGTGRTHQIRVHALYSGHPIVGDEKYGDKDFNKKLSQLGCKRMFLHAYSLNFTLPSTSQVISVTAPLPPDLEILLSKL